MTRVTQPVPVQDLRFDAPIYSRADAARLLQLPAPTVGNWVRGYQYNVGHQARSASPLLIPPNGGRWLSFANLVEAHTVAAFRSSGVSMQKIRPALAYIAEHLEVDHPLASEHFLTDGAHVFFRYVKQEGTEDLVALLDLSKGGQVVFDKIVDRYLQRVDWGADDYAERLWPAGRDAGIVIDPKRSFGRPILHRAGVRVEDVVGRVRAGESPASVACDFDLAVEDVQAACEFAPRLALAA